MGIMGVSRLVGIGALLLVMGGAWPLGAAGAEPKPGGVIRAAMEANPPMLDPHLTQVFATRQIGYHVFETLFTWDEQYNLIPQLVERQAVSPDGKTYTFVLRHGIRFHNGKAMTAEDVKASIERFRKHGVRASDFVAIKDMVVVDPSTIRFELAEPQATFLAAFANPLGVAAILPKEVAQTGTPLRGREQLVGTGPFELVEWIPDRHVRLKRFAGYSADKRMPGTGLGGERVAHADEVYLIPATETAARVAGLEAGDYDFAESVPFPAYERLRGNPAVIIGLFKQHVWPGLEFNHSSFLGKNPKLRQAILVGLDQDEIMKAVTGGRKEFYRLDPSLFFQEQPWHTTAGGEWYNRRDKVLAKRLIAESGYKGEEMILVTNRDYDSMYKAGLASSEQLKDLGLNVKLLVLDWPAQRALQPKETGWHMGYTVFTLRFDPSGYNATFHCKAKRWRYCHPEMDRLLDAGMREGDPRRRQKIYEEVQKLVYADVPLVKHGDLFALQAAARHLQGFTAWYLPRFWNVWTEKRR